MSYYSSVMAGVWDFYVIGESWFCLKQKNEFYVPKMRG